MSLNDIQKYTRNKSPEEFLSLMYQQRDSIVKKRKEIEMNEKIINAKIKLMEEAAYIDFNQITLESFSTSTLYLSENIKDISDEEFVKVVSNFIDELYISKLDGPVPA